MLELRDAAPISHPDIQHGATTVTVATTCTPSENLKFHEETCNIKEQDESGLVFYMMMYVTTQRACDCHRVCASNRYLNLEEGFQ